MDTNSTLPQESGGDVPPPATTDVPPPTTENPPVEQQTTPPSEPTPQPPVESNNPPVESPPTPEPTTTVPPEVATTTESPQQPSGNPGQPTPSNNPGTTTRPGNNNSHNSNNNTRSSASRQPTGTGSILPPSSSNGVPSTGSEISGNETGSTTNKGAIAGGVVGGVVGVALIAGLLFFLFRRNRKQKKKGDTDSVSNYFRYDPNAARDSQDTTWPQPRSMQQSNLSRPNVTPAQDTYQASPLSAGYNTDATEGQGMDSTRQEMGMYGYPHDGVAHKPDEMYNNYYYHETSPTAEGAEHSYPVYYYSDNQQVDYAQHHGQDAYVSEMTSPVHATPGHYSAEASVVEPPYSVGSTEMDRYGKPNAKEETGY